jgi:hypothetical protein
VSRSRSPYKLLPPLSVPLIEEARQQGIDLNAQQPVSLKQLRRIEENWNRIQSGTFSLLVGSGQQFQEGYRNRHMKIVPRRGSLH